MTQRPSVHNRTQHIRHAPWSVLCDQARAVTNGCEFLGVSEVKSTQYKGSDRTHTGKFVLHDEVVPVLTANHSYRLFARGLAENLPD